MRTLFTIVSGFGLAVVMLMTGAVGATIFFRAEPENAPSAKSVDFDVWTNGPAKVDTISQSFERLPARTVSQSSSTPTEPDSTLALATEAVQASVLPDHAGSSGGERINTAHQDWCSKRFRSYSADDNSYTSYRGAKRQCKSPYSHEPSNLRSPAETPYPIVEASLDAEYQPGVSAKLSMEHVRSCLSRYRSYRPEDNSYQPFSGGPRRQCE